MLLGLEGNVGRGEAGAGESLPFDDSRVLESCVCRSVDDGCTWDVTWTMPPAVDGLGHLVPFGDIQQGADGALCAGVYAFTLDHAVGHCYLLRSADDGHTWTHCAPIVQNRHVEAAVLHTGSGRWLAAARVFGTLELDVFGSDDDGLS